MVMASILCSKESLILAMAAMTSLRVGSGSSEAGVPSFLLGGVVVCPTDLERGNLSSLDCWVVLAVLVVIAKGEPVPGGHNP